MSIEIAEICRYPLKGLNAEKLERTVLTPGQGLPHDRRFALAHGSTRFDAAAPEWLPKTNFLCLLRDEKLAQLRAEFDSESEMLTIKRGGKAVVRAKASEPLGHTLIGQFFAGFMGPAARGTPKLVEAPGHMFSDVRDKVVSIVNLASVKDLERIVRRPIDPLRFRANFYLAGARPWSEFLWVGQEIGLGDARLRVENRIERCGATNVDPETAARDMNLPRALQQGFRHTHMGIYARVLTGGEVSRAEVLSPPS